MEAVLSELERAGPRRALDALYRELVANAHDLHTIAVAGEMAAHRGDFEGLWKLFESFNRLPSGTRSTIFSGASLLRPRTHGYHSGPRLFHGPALRHKTGSRAHAAVLRLLDDYMTALRRPALAAERIRMAKKSSTTLFRYEIISSSNIRSLLMIDYPAPGAYFDAGAILLLRNAFELFKRDDLLSDLLAHVGRRADAAAGDAVAELYYRLELNAVLWWAGDKDGALRRSSAPSRWCRAMPS